MWNPLIWILLFGICITQAVPIEEKAQRDSYGKLIQAKNKLDGKKFAQTDDGIEFEIPSYASGIVVPKPYNDLLPPLTSSEAGSADSDIIYVETLVGGISSNNIRDGKSIRSYQKDYTGISSSETNLPIKTGKTLVTVEESIEVPYTDLNPPYFDNDKPYSTEDVVDEGSTQNVEIPLFDGDIYKGGFGGPPGILGIQEAVGTSVGTDINSGLTDLISSSPLVTEAVNTDKYDGDIYKGSFGGPSGILANQKFVGTTDINFRLSTSSPKKIIQNPDDSLFEGDIYKGGFGGPAGILGNQRSLDMYHEQMKTPTINQGSRRLKPTPPLNKVAVTNFIPPIKGSTTESSGDISLYNGDIYVGRFGGPTGLLGEQKSPGTFYQNQQQNSEKLNKDKKIINENTTEKIKVNQLQQTTGRPKKKIVSRFEFSSIQKPVTNLKKHDEKKATTTSDHIHESRISGKSVETVHQNKNDNNHTEIARPIPTSNTTISPPSTELLPPFNPLSDTIHHESDSTTIGKLSYDGDADKGIFSDSSGILGNQESVGTYHQTKKPEEPTTTTIINDYKIMQNEDTTTEMPNSIDSTLKIHAQTIPIINVEIEVVTSPSTDVIPALIEPIDAAVTRIEENKEIDPYLDITTYSTPVVDIGSDSVSTKRSIINYGAHPTIEKLLYEGDIYKGGFGGPAGFLGEQKSIGTYQQENKIQENTNVPEIDVTTTSYKNTKNNTQDVTTNIRNTKSPFRNLLSDIPAIRIALNNNNDAQSEVNTKSFFSSPITTSTLSIQSTTPETPSKFFTPPFFSPKIEQEQTFLIQNGNVPSFSEKPSQPPPVLVERFNSNNNNNNGKNDFVSDFVHPNSAQFNNRDHFSPPQQQHQSNIIPNTLNAPGQQQVFTSPIQLEAKESSATPLLNSFNNGIETVPRPPIALNTFGNIQGFYNPIQFLSSTGIFYNNKFTGNFGGAPGVLGNQKQPGFGVQPQIPTSSSFAVAATVVTNNKYSGGFGGPPGVLTPFDNKAK